MSVSLLHLPLPKHNGDTAYQMGVFVCVWNADVH